MYVSIGLRFRVEVEALNMAESVGNYVRHRTAPILVVERDESGAVKGYKITMAPAVSGQSIAYGYMKALVELAPKYELRVCDDCRNYQQIGGFFKRAGNTELGHDERIKECVVEDLTGFMATKEKGGQKKGKRQQEQNNEEKQEESGEQEKGRMLRRTSPVMFSYMVPDSVSARGVVVPELHVRYNLQDPEQQVPYQIEAGTAIYIHSVAIDVDRIGRLESEKDPYVENRAKRVELAFDALKTLYGGLLFGAKKARYLPIIETLGAIAGVADPLPFNVTPPRFGDYVAENLLRAKSYNVSDVKLFCFDKEGITSCKRAEGVDASDSLEALIDKVKEAVMEKIGAVEK